MDDYIKIELTIAKKYGAVEKKTRKSIGDFLLNDDERLPVNVKSNNVDKKNYSPNIISAKRLIKWLEEDGNKLYFIFVDYKKIKSGLKVLKDSGLVPVEHLSWDCLTIESQGWGVIQMSRPLKIDKNQNRIGFLKAMKKSYELYIKKEEKKINTIKKMIKKI